MSSGDVKVRLEQSNDVTEIHEVLIDAFPTYAEAILVNRLRDQGQLVQSWVAEADGKIVGHLALSPVTIDGHMVELLGLAPVAVRELFQKAGIGTELIQTAIEWGRSNNHLGIVVLGEPGYYGRFGFQRASDLGIGNEYEVDEPFQAIIFDEQRFSGCEGIARYSDVFASLGE